MNILEKLRTKEIGNGIYSISKENNFSAENLIVAVHPFFREGSYNTFLEMNAFLEQNTTPILTLEAESKFYDTIKHYSSLRTREELYFFKTPDNNVEIGEKSWENLSGFIKSLNGTSPVYLIGGNYWQGSFQGKHKGCLGITEERLNDFGIETKISPRLTFSAVCC